MSRQSLVSSSWWPNSHGGMVCVMPKCKSPDLVRNALQRWHAQEAEAAERSAARAQQAAEQRAASAAEQEKRVAAAQADLSAAQQRFQQQQAQLEVNGSNQPKSTD